MGYDMGSLNEPKFYVVVKKRHNNLSTPSSKPPFSSIFTTSCARLGLNPMNPINKTAVNQTTRVFMILSPTKKVTITMTVLEPHT